MKDIINPCIYYVCAGADCKKGFRKVMMDKCRNCEKYRPRKSGKKPESIKEKRRKDADRHDNWKTRE